jgi:hypothetical protein
MRAVLGVVVAFVAMSVTVLALSLAPWFVFGVDGVLEPGRFDSTPIFAAYALVVGVIGGAFAGWLCAAISRSRPAVYVLAVLCAGAGLTNHFSQNHKPEPGPRQPGVSVMDAVVQRKEPDWFTLVTPALGVAALVLAGRARLSE